MAKARRPVRTPAGTAAPLLTRDTDAPMSAAADSSERVSGAPARRRSRRATPAPAPTAGLRVGVRHGDLRYAPYPVLVGHYLGDTIVSAEAALDRQMRGHDREGPLSRRRDLGLYPGPLGTHAVFFHGDTRSAPRGAIVVGLGQVGELSPAPLQAGVRDALLEYALRLLQVQDESARDTAAPVLLASVSALLVGTGAGSLSLRDSLEAMVRGALDANRRLEDSRLAHRVRIACVEFIELFEDVAIGAARELSSLLANGELAAMVQWPEQLVVPGEGCRHRIRFDDDRGWWQRIEIVEDRKAEVLRFVSTTNRARAEESLSAGQLQLADAFVAQACSSAIANGDIAKSLFEMLLPARLKESAPDQRDTVIMVDETSARFPWELLEDRWNPAGEPPAVAAGLVRQLKVQAFRASPMHTFVPNALVIGNPELDGWEGFSALPGARLEAECVSELLVSRGYDCRSVVDGAASEIVDALHGDAWRILHLAGHGVHEFESDETVPDAEDGSGNDAPHRPRRKRLSGMVIGRETILTPGDVEQMRHVPELVFVNCCHLGQSVGEASTPFHRLAANLGVQFVRMGVRAVVCAGWAVGDAAALTFAQTFYASLLNGETFGDAVLHARRATWSTHPEVNTWGAYQCYGDPAFRLVRDVSAPKAVTPLPYVSPAELVADLRNRAAAASTGDAADFDDRARQDEERKALAELLGRIPAAASPGQRHDWTVRADVCAALGFAYSEAGLFRDAIAWLDRALAARVGDCPVRTLEQSVNCQVRLAMRQWREARSTRKRAAVPEAVRSAVITELNVAVDTLRPIAERAPTPERHALLGGAFKRLAWVSTGRERMAALRNAAALFREAFDARGQDDTYAFTNWAAACALLAAREPSAAPRDWNESLGELLEAQERKANAAMTTNPGFWLSAGFGDLTVTRLLLATDGTSIRDGASLAASQYREAVERGGSPRAFASIRDHIDWLSDLVTGPDIVAPWPEELPGSLLTIRRALPG